MTSTRQREELHRDRVCMTCATNIAGADGGALSNTEWPDKETRNAKAVDMTFAIGSVHYWLEHTELEFADGQKYREKRLRNGFSAWAEGLESKLPKGALCELVLPAETDWSEHSNAAAVRAEVGDWILAQVGDLHQASLGRNNKNHWESIARPADSPVPFDITLHCVAWPPETKWDHWLRVTWALSPLSDNDVKARVQQAVDDKLPKLADAKREERDRSVLLLEVRYNVLQTGANAMMFSHDPVLEHFRPLVEGRADKPDLAFLVNTAPSQSYWLAFKLKDGKQWWGDGTLPDKIEGWWPVSEAIADGV